MDLGDSKGPKKPLDATINLVPFIDLMAVTISFLIATAVWTQIGRLQVSGGGGDGDPTPEKDDKTVPVTLFFPRRTSAHGGTSTFDPIPIVRDAKQQIDLTKLTERFKDVKEKLGPDQTAITVQTEDAVRYEDLVHVIDQCIGDGFPSVSVAPVST
jgi:biopolymer transport protein ExbD